MLPASDRATAMHDTETSAIPNELPAWRQAVCWRVMRGSILVALVVGTLLNAINQGDAFIAGGEVNWLKVVLTYLVPFFVATYGAYNACRQDKR